jgi:hypothetical protein
VKLKTDKNSKNRRKYFEINGPAFAFAVCCRFTEPGRDQAGDSLCIDVKDLFIFFSFLLIHTRLYQETWSQIAVPQCAGPGVGHLGLRL